MAVFCLLLTLLVLLALLSAGLAAALHLRRRIEFLEAENRHLKLAAVEDAQQIENQIAGLTTRVEAAERRYADAIQRPLRSINYTQRSQILRMIRRGDAPRQIAEVSGAPLSHIKLMMKLPTAIHGPPRAAQPSPRS